MVALLMRTKASRQASAGGHFSIRSERTDVAMRMVKSTSSNVSCERTRVECQMAYRNEIPVGSISEGVSMSPPGK